jgi:hypothetical protein
MASGTRASITSFARGHEFTPVTFTITADDVRGYLDATGDVQGYGTTVPPLAVVALALGSLQREVVLPDGSLHTGQEVEHEKSLQSGEQLTMTGRLAQRSERQGFVICVLELEVADADGVGLRARATIMAPGGGA